MNNSLTRCLFLKITLLVVGLMSFDPAFADDLPKPGDNLADFTINAPAADAALSYLGLGRDTTFALDQIKAKLVLLEIVGVYCPKCHIQFPRMKKLFYQIQKDKALAAKVKFLAIAVGANSREVAYLQEQFKLPYPVVTDPQFEIHKILGEPRTPFTLLVMQDRKIGYAHLGLIENFDKFLAEIRKLAG